MIETGIPVLDREFKGIDYAIILAEGVPGSGKEVLGYHVLNKALESGVHCVVITSSRSYEDAEKDLEYYRMRSKPITWIETIGKPKEADNVVSANIGELFSVSDAIKRQVEKSEGKEVVVVMDFISSALMSHPIEKIYAFFSGIVVELKKRGAVAYVLIENQMHDPKDVVSMEQLADIVLDFKVLEEGLDVKQGLVIRKKMGRPTIRRSYEFELTEEGLKVV